MPSELLVPKHRTSSPHLRDQTPQRRASLKKKVWNKVLGSKPSQSNVSDLYASEKASIRSASHPGRHSGETLRRPSSEAGRTSSETIRKATRSQSALDGTIISSLDLCHANATEPSLYPPYPPQSIAKVRLSTQAEVTHLDLDVEQSIWIAVTASVEASLREEDVQLVPLNIVVILDNSAHAYPDSLKTASRAILDLATELRHPKDRLAIICTSPAHPWKDNRNGYTLRALLPIDLVSIQKDLRLAVHARPEIAPQNLTMDQTLADAFYLVANGDDMEATGGQYCHVVIITPNPAACRNNLGSKAPVPVHVLQPGSVSWSQPEMVNAGHVIAENASGPTIKERLKGMLLHARGRTMPGTIYDTKLHVAAVSQRCRILEIVGQQRFSSLAVGQSATVLCKVVVLQDDVPTNTPTDKVNALFAEIESMLGVSEVQLLRATFTYRHSLFPNNTTLTATSTCALPIISKASIWSPVGDNTTALSSGSQLISEVYKKLILCVANSATPMNALNTLQTLKIPEMNSSSSQSFLSAIKAELSYHIKTTAKYNIPPASSPRSTNNGTQTANLMSPPHPSTPHPDNRPLSPVAESPTFASSTSSKTTIHIHSQRSPTDPDFSTDAARKIWKTMKRDSQSTRDLLMKRSVTTGALGWKDDGKNDGRLIEIRRMAVRNKRSIGADTLRSISLGAEREWGMGSDESRDG